MNPGAGGGLGVNPNKEGQMAFADNLKELTPVTGIEKMELVGADGKVVATIESKPGQTGCSR